MKVTDKLKHHKMPIYKCYYCKALGWGVTEFEAKPGTSDGGKHSTVSSQVQCPKCGNFLKNKG